MRGRTKGLFERISTLTVALSVSLIGALTEGASFQGPLLRAEGNRLFLNDSPCRLIGYSDLGILAERSFDYAAFFTILENHDVNLVRPWVCYHWAQDLLPFERREKLYDLETRNETFYKRLIQLVDAAGQHGIIVQVCLFDGCQLDDDKKGHRWSRSPYNNRNNMQDFLENSAHFDDVGNECWARAHEPLIDHIVEAIGNAPNVIFEIMNEPDIHGRDLDQLRFSQQVCRRLRDRLSLKFGSRLISVNVCSGPMETWALQDPEVDLISFHLGGLNLPSEAWRDLPKPVIVSNDGHDTQRVFDEVCWPEGLSRDARVAMTRTLLGRCFTQKAPLGHMHFDFLDKGINGPTWKTLDYNPDLKWIDEEILDVLSTFSVLHVPHIRRSFPDTPFLVGHRPHD